MKMSQLKLPRKISSCIGPSAETRARKKREVVDVPMEGTTEGCRNGRESRREIERDAKTMKARRIFGFVHAA